MNVAIDARELGRPCLRGIGRYILELVRGIFCEYPDVRMFLLCERGQDLARVLGPELLEDDRCRVAHLPTKGYRYNFWEQVYVPSYIMWLSFRYGGVDLYHGTANSMPLVLPVKSVVTIHDLNLMLDENRRDSPRGRYVRFLMPYIVERAATIITVSRTTRDQLRTLYGDQVRARVVSIYNGLPGDVQTVASEYRKRGNLEQVRCESGGERFVLVLGASDEFKGTDLAIRGYAVSSARKRGFSLVVTGNDAASLERRRGLVRSLGIEGCVRLLPFVDRGDLVDLYRRAEIFLFPSAMEGFGIPIIEALATGCRVIAYDTEITREVAPRCLVFFRERTPESVAGALDDVLQESEADRRVALEKGFEVSARFTWERSVLEHVNVYREVVGGGGVR